LAPMSEVEESTPVSDAATPSNNESHNRAPGIKYELVPIAGRFPPQFRRIRVR
jgi:hypothetical protein